MIGYNIKSSVKKLYLKNGYLFENEEQFVDSIGELFSSPIKYKDISSFAYHDSHDRFSIKKYCESVELFVESIYES